MIRIPAAGDHRDSTSVRQGIAGAYNTDQHGDGRGVAAQLARQLADPRPKDVSVTGELDEYRNLAARWTDWREVRAECRDIAAAMLLAEE